ncbi:MAG: zf-HC2 domain-containing protein [Chloroflexi bacterium]|nr:zf-HC2 domain-containing protein [Chloroflexota bacterium]
MTNPPAGPPLDCAHARALIDAFLVDELDPVDAARLSAHVKGCAACTVEIGGSTLVMTLLGSLPTPSSTPRLDERILLAALDDRTRRHAHRSWLSDLRTQVIRGTMRTTATLMATIVSVALLGAVIVLAASQIVPQLGVFTGQRATIAPVATPTPSVPAVQSAEPSTTAKPRPSPVISATPVPVIVPAPTDSAAPTMSPEPSPLPTPSIEPSPSPTAEPTATPTPTPQPTEKPRRTQPPPVEPTPSP